MKLLIGLGNPGEKYKKTRHNAGFMFLNFFAEKNNFSDFQEESKFKANISTGNYNGEKILLVQPLTYMNLSGEAIQKIMHFYKISFEDICVIYDDISMDFGKVRFRSKGSAGGQNGVKNIIQRIGEEFPRIKIGIDLDKRYDVSNWVLSKFTEEELIDLDNEVFPKVIEKLKEEF